MWLAKTTFGSGGKQSPLPASKGGRSTEKQRENNDGKNFEKVCV